MQIPLFLLHTVLIPGAHLPLKVFETRYLDMVSQCLKNNTPFGVCLIRSGQEIGSAGEPWPVGTLATIEQWDMPKPGVLHIEVVGTERFSIVDQDKHSELITATVEIWPADPDLEIPARYAGLVEFLRAVLKDREAVDEANLENAGWVSWRLAALLPVSNEIRQQWLMLRDPVMRLGEILEELTRLADERR
jgi:Lon protease-like protein